MNNKPNLDLKKLLARENILLGLILLVAFAILVIRIDEPFGGFHGFNEAHYTIQARQFLGHPITYLLTGTKDLLNPPFFSYLLFISFKIFGVSEASARIVPVISTVLSVFFVYKIGKLIYNQTVGLIAAFLLAVNPGMALVGRNVQLEATSILFTLAALYYYLKSKTGDEAKNKCLAGLFLGLGVFTKLTAGLILPAIAIWELIVQKNLRWINRSFIYFVLIAFLVPVPWFGYHLIFSRQALVGGQQYLAGTFVMPDLWFLKRGLLSETVWTFSPIIFSLFLGGLVTLLIKRKKSDIIIIASLAIYTTFYLFYHFHSYYLVTIVPFGVLVVARMSDWMKNKRIVWAVTAFLVIASLFFSELMLFGNKYGYTSFKEAGDIIKRESGNKKVIVQVTENMYGSYWPVIAHYLPPGSKVTSEKQKRVKNIYYLDFCPDPNLITNKKKGVYVISNNRIIPVLFGYSVFQMPPNSHLLTNGQISFEKVGSVGYFALDKVPQKNLVLVDKLKYLSP